MVVGFRGSLPLTSGLHSEQLRAQRTVPDQQSAYLSLRLHSDRHESVRWFRLTLVREYPFLENEATSGDTVSPRNKISVKTPYLFRKTLPLPAPRPATSLMRGVPVCKSQDISYTHTKSHPLLVHLEAL